MDALKPLNRDKTLGERVYEQLKTALMTGALTPGQKLTVRSLADTLEVSVTPAREGLNRLISDGVLEMKSAKTIIVPVLTPERLEEITKIRIELEGLAAEEATANFSASEITALERVQDKLKAAMDRDDYREVLAHNEKFRFGLYKKSGMPTLVSMIESMWLRIGPSLNLLYPEFSEKRWGIANHADAIAGLKAGDAKAVRKAIVSDIKAGFKTLSKALEHA